MKRSEVLRRLGVPQFRHQCPQCYGYVGQLFQVFDWSEPSGMKKVMACGTCAERIEERNRERTKEHSQNKFAYQRANAEYRSAQERASSYEYLAACEAMRRELGLK